MIRLRLLGECTIELETGAIGPDSQVLFGALLYLALERGKRVPRQTLHRLLWPEADDEAGRHNLRQTLYKLRQYGVRLDGTQTSVRLAPEDVTGDVIELAQGTPPSDAIVRRASLLGELLPGYAPGSQGLREWVEGQRARVHADLRRALLTAMLEHRARGDWPGVESLARQVLVYDPLNEEATLAMAEAAALSGGKTQAIGILDRYLREIGSDATDIRIPAQVLRRRIAERLPSVRYSSAADACFVGRAASIAFLMGIYRGARAGRGGAALVWGEAGIGKTRLVTEFAKMAVLQGSQLQRASCQAWDAHRPLSIFTDLVPALQALPGALGVSPRSLPYLKRLTQHDASAGGPSAEAQQAEYLFANIRQAIFDLFDAVLSEGSLVLIVEDMHWLDSASGELLQELAQMSASRPLMLVLTSRNSPSGKPHVPGIQTHRLEGLDEQASHQLLDAVTREHGKVMNAEARGWCLPLTEGHPLFLREIAERWLTDETTRSVPSSLTRLLEQRLDRLSADGLRLLQTTALLERHASLGAVERVLGMTSGSMLEALHELEEYGLIKQSHSILICQHDLVAHSSLQRLRNVGKAMLHHRIAVSLRDVAAQERTPALLWDCAMHFVHSHERRQAIALLLDIAAHFRELGRADETIAAFDEAMSLAQDASTASQICAARLSVLQLYGRWASVEGAIRTFRVAYPASGDTTLAFEFELIQSLWYQEVGIESLVGRIRQFVVNDGISTADRIRSATLGLMIADDCGYSSQAIELFHLATEKLGSESGHLREQALMRMVYHASFGDLDEALRIADGIVTEAMRSQVSPDAVPLNWCAIPYWKAGKRESAEKCARTAFEISERLCRPRSALASADTLCSIAMAYGDEKQAQLWYAHAVAWRDKFYGKFHNDMLSLTSAKLMLASRRPREALRILEATGDSWRGDLIKRRRLEVLALQVRARMALGLDIEKAMKDAILATFAELRHYASQDFAAQTIYLLLAADRRDEADEFITGYLTERRERSPFRLPLSPHDAAVYENRGAASD